MKNLYLLKLLNLIVLFVILNDWALGQSRYFVPDAKKDSVWVQEAIANKMHPINIGTSGRGPGDWIDGKVLYSPDGLLKATQLTAGPRIFTTIIQFSHYGKVFQQDLNYNTDFSSYTLNSIHKLPGDKPAYLFLLSSIQDTAGYEHDWLADFKTRGVPADSDFNHIKTVSYVASAFRLEHDSLFETSFPLTKSQAADTANLENSKSFGFISDIKHSAKSPKPFLKYDRASHMLRFLSNSSRENDSEAYAEPNFLTVESGNFEYKDTSFVLANDTSYVYPLLDSDETVAHQNYKAGKYIIKAVTTKSYHDFGNDIFPVLTIKYAIGADTLASYNDSGYDEGTKIDPTPEYRIQANSSLILLLTDNTSDHRPGMCGSATYTNSYFWLIEHNKHPQRLFSFSYGSCSSDITYTFTRNRKEISGKFYLAKPSDNRDLSFVNSYWKNRSTYVFELNDSEANLLRYFYLHFNPINKKSPVTLTAGTLHRLKTQVSQ